MKGKNYVLILLSNTNHIFGPPNSLWGGEVSHCRNIPANKCGNDARMSISLTIMPND